MTTSDMVVSRVTRRSSKGVLGYRGTSPHSSTSVVSSSPKELKIDSRHYTKMQWNLKLLQWQNLNRFFMIIFLYSVLMGF